jgi:zinc D-Ala-D-Ala carboxypeptidase
MPRSLTEHFTLDELVLSQTAARLGIDNTPPPDVVRNLRRLATVLEEVRTLLGAVPILVSSGYRSTALNKEIGGSKRSAHMEGLAADFTAPAFGTVMQVARTVAGSELAYDQVIHEYGRWVHLGLSRSGGKPRGQRLSIFVGTGYLNGIVGRPA